MFQFIKIKFTFLIFSLWELTFLGLVLFSGCSKSVEKRTYDEIATVTQANNEWTSTEADSSESFSAQDPRALLQEMLAREEDPHVFMKGQSFEQKNDLESLREQQETFRTFAFARLLTRTRPAISSIKEGGAGSLVRFTGKHESPIFLQF